MNIATRDVTIHLPGLTLCLAAVRDVEALITDPADAEAVPLWAEIWPAARGLAGYIWERLDFTGATVLELGAGLGLPGVVCGLKGARVTFSDYRPEALQLAAVNAARHGVTDARRLLADWRCFPVTERFDCLVGSDILYDPKFHPCLLRICRQSLKPGGQLLFSHPGRPAAFAFIEQWRKETACREHREIIAVNVPDPYFPVYHIHIHHLTLC